MDINNKDKNGLHERPNDALMFMSSNKEIRTAHTWPDFQPRILSIIHTSKLLF